MSAKESSILSRSRLDPKINIMVSAQVIATVLQKAVQVATHSWEYGTVAEALLEWNDPKLSIWNDPFPGGKIPTLDVANVSALSYVKPFIRLTGNTLVDGDGKNIYIYLPTHPRKESSRPNPNLEIIQEQKPNQNQIPSHLTNQVKKQEQQATQPP
jgi:hypothetical protein